MSIACIYLGYNNGDVLLKLGSRGVFLDNQDHEQADKIEMEICDMIDKNKE